jgi:O-antigen ligase
VAALLLLLAFILFLKSPELALAILFNGTLIYFYVVYKSGFHTNRILTGAFYGFLTFSFLLGEVLLFRKEHKNFRLSFVDILFFILFILFFLSYLAFSMDNDMAYKKITYAPLLAVMPYFGSRFLLSEKRIKNFFKYSVLVAMILMPLAFYEHFFNPVLAQRTRFSMFLFENTDLKDNPILFGSTYAVLLIIVLVRMLEGGKLRPINIFIIAVSAYFILLSGSRGVIISLLTAIIFCLFFISKIKPRTKIYASVFMVLIFFGIYKYLISQRLANFYSYSISADALQDSNSSIQMRIIMWKQAICDFVESPIIGAGTGNSNNKSGFPHNIVLEVAAEFGVLGILIFILLVYLTVRKAVVFLRDKQLSNSHMLMRLLLVLFIYFLTHAMFSGHLANQSRLYIIMGLIACLGNLYRFSSSDKLVNFSVKNGDNFTKQKLEAYNYESCQLLLEPNTADAN